MSRFVCIFICLLAVYCSARAQSICSDCEMACLCKETIGCKYDDTRKRIITDNWTDYEGVDIEDVFPVKRPVNILSIRFDGLGCVYPGTFKNERIKEWFLDDEAAKSAFRALTFYSLLRLHGQKLNPDEFGGKEFFDKMRSLASRNPIGDSLVFANMMEFRRLWNEKFLSLIVDRIRQLSAENSLEELIGFIPGYNVPYSLAHLQGVALFNDMIDSLPEERTAKKLFVRIFWPSNDGKKKKFECGKCKMNNQLKLINAKLYNFVTNRAYFSGLTMREMINQLPDQLRIKLVSHSFGAVISSAVVLPPDTKFKRNTIHSVYNSQLLRAFNKVPIPKRDIRIFMSAPGIPGVTNFERVNVTDNSRHLFYISYNKKDKVLRKKVVPVFGWFTRASQGNSTSLGCDYKGQIRRVTHLFAEAQLSSRLKTCQTSSQKNHDYFCYRQQPAFLHFFTEFVRL